MGVIGTFGSFTTARMGIYASQASLNVTGNNIANINTEGYCRQRMDLVSLHSGGNDRYSNMFNKNVGYGVLCTGVSQSRDPYLDIRYRTENSSVGAMESKLNGLTELSKVLDEVGAGIDGEGMLEAQFNTIYEQLEILSRNVGSEEYDTLVRSSCDTLCKLFNSYAKELETIRDNQETSLKRDTDTVNTLLNNIRDLNEQIRTSNIHGDRALELRDQRNLFIDQLSSYVKIDVTYTTEALDEFSSVEKLVISLADTKPAINLVDGIYATQFELEEKVTLTVNGATQTVDNFVENSTENHYLFQLAKLTDSRGREQKNSTEQLLGDTTLYGSLQSTRELLTRRGEFSTAEDLAADPGCNIKRGIPYYQNALDALARKFATTLNAANTGTGKYDAYPQRSITIPLDTADPDYNKYNAILEFEVTDQNGNVKKYKLPDGTYKIYEFDNNCVLNLPERLTDLSILKNAVPVDPNDPPLTDQQITAIETEQADHFARGCGLPTVQLGGNLFSNSGDGNNADDITAANISISKDWSTGDVRILTTTRLGADGKPLSTAKENLNHIISLMTTKLDFNARDVVADAADTGKYFTGTFQEFFADMANTLSSDVQTTTKLYNNYDSAALNLDNDRSSVSGVDLNDEATNMMQFQKSYSAACRLLTTIDSMLDKLINGTAV